MDSAEVLRAWKELLPPSVSVSVGPIVDCATPLTVWERLSIGDLESGRLREFECGRMHAKLALSLLGVDAVHLPVGPDRAPLWPAGVVGSLAHIGGWIDGQIAAAAARTRDVCAIGIDVERDDGLHPSLWSYVLTEGEFERILSLPPQMRAIEAQVIWCAKEAVTKAARRVVEPRALDVECDLTDGSFVARLRRTGPKMCPPEKWPGRTARAQGLILAAVTWPAKFQL